MYAIIEAGGKQYHVREGDVLTINRMAGEVGATIDLDRVLLVGGGENEVQIGAPHLSGVLVRATIVDHGRDRKKIIFRYRNKNRYRVKKGHRQPITRLQIESIAL